MEPGVERFVDEILGPQEQDPSQQCGDVLARDRNGNWTYQYAVTVDDHLQQITDVIRGEDLLLSTGRQIRLARLLGRDTPPRFWHHKADHEISHAKTEQIRNHDTVPLRPASVGLHPPAGPREAANLQA